MLNNAISCNNHHLATALLARSNSHAHTASSVTVRAGVARATVQVRFVALGAFVAVIAGVALLAPAQSRGGWVPDAIAQVRPDALSNVASVARLKKDSQTWILLKHFLPQTIFKEINGNAGLCSQRETKTST